jgi:GT2 family glycosyltransferase
MPVFCMPRGSLIARQDADDVSAATRIEKQVRFLARHPDVGIVGTSFEEMTIDGTPLRMVAAATDPEAIRERLLLGMPFAGASIVVRREVFAQLGGYDPTFDNTIGEDYDLLIRASEITALAALAEPLYHYRTGNSKSMCGAVAYRYDAPRRLAHARAVGRGNLRFVGATPEGSDHNTPM